MHNRFPNLGIWQRDWEPPENLTLEGSGIWLQNLHRTGETDSWRVQTKSCAHQDPEERSGDSMGDWPRLACECSGVPEGGVGQQWPAAGSGAPNGSVWGGNTALQATENWIKDLLSMAPPIRTRVSFPHSQSLPSGSFYKSIREWEEWKPLRLLNLF